MKKNKVIVVTPTYNRKKKLRILYESLKKQTISDFDWIIIDDGSTDGTDRYIKDIKTNNNKFRIIYKKKNNGGKHTALNVAFDMVKRGLLVIIDSDDYLVSDAIETILSDWEKYGDEDLSGLCYKRMSNNNKIMIKNFGD